MSPLTKEKEIKKATHKMIREKKNVAEKVLQTFSGTRAVFSALVLVNNRKLFDDHS